MHMRMRMRMSTHAHSNNTHHDTRLKVAQHVKHGRRDGQLRQRAHAKLADARRVRAAPKLQHLLHEDEADQIRRVVTPGVRGVGRVLRVACRVVRVVCVCLATAGRRLARSPSQ
jgi:hypothetical protein